MLANQNELLVIDLICGRIGWSQAVGFSPYNNNWKLQRKSIVKVATSNASVAVFDRIQEVEAAHFLVNVLGSQVDLFDHIRK
jgi:hypothetical protein